MTEKEKQLLTFHHAEIHKEKEEAAQKIELHKYACPNIDVQKTQELNWPMCNYGTTCENAYNPELTKICPLHLKYDHPCTHDWVKEVK